MSLVITAARAAALAASKTSDNPILAWDNLAAKAASVTSNRPVLSNGSLANALSGTTFDFWRPQDSASVTSPTFLVDMGSGVTISPDFIGFVGHNLATIGITGIDVHSSPDGAAWTLVGSVAVAGMGGVSDGYYMAAPTPRRYWRLTFNGLPALALMRVAGIFIGNVFTSPVRFYQDFAPVLTPTEVELQSNVSAGGNILGSSVVKRGSRLAVALNHITPAILRSAAWLALQQAFNEGAPMFFAWRPTTFDTDLHYIWRDGGVIRPGSAGVRDLMMVQFDARVFEG